MTGGRPALVGLAGLGAGGLVGHGLPAVVAWRQARNRLLPDLAGVGRPGHVALTFDDGPDAASTPHVLAALDELGWRATFFLLGSQVRRHPSLAEEVAAAGHEIGVHGDTHTSHLRRPWTWTTGDVARGAEVVGDVTGTEPRWFRPPYGALSSSSLVAARACRLQTVLWTTWGKDWRADATPARVAATVARTWHPGATVLLHDTDVTSAPGSWRATLGSLHLLAQRWAGAGLEIGTLGDHGIGESG
ncbi:MAG: polysaccharide deacetylase family protein [Acidimicrobiales bacterium]